MLQDHRGKHMKDPVIYIMACRIGPFAGHFYRKIHSLGGRIFLNPDGHEWMRKKWSVPVRRYWKFSEWMMVRHCDLVVCDSASIENIFMNTTGTGAGIRARRLLPMAQKPERAGWRTTIRNCWNGIRKRGCRREAITYWWAGLCRKITTKP